MRRDPLLLFFVLAFALTWASWFAGRWLVGDVAMEDISISAPLGVASALWHLPLFYVPGADTYGQSFVVYALQVTALSVARLYAVTNACCW